MVKPVVAKKAAPPSAPKAKPKTPGGRGKPPISASGAASAAKAAPPKVLKLKELVETVATAAAVKKKTARTVIEATLSVLGGALGQGVDLNLPALGKVHVSRHKDRATAEVLMIKLKRAHKGPKQALAAGKEAAAPLDPAKDKG